MAEADVPNRSHEIEAAWSNLGGLHRVVPGRRRAHLEQARSELSGSSLQLNHSSAERGLQSIMNLFCSGRGLREDSDPYELPAFLLVVDLGARLDRC
jgi:hypothetical protein